MSTLAPDVNRRARPERGAAPRRRDRTTFAAAHAGVEQTRPGGEATLDDVIVGAWEGLLAHRTVSCPVCSGALAPRYGAGAAPVGGRCSDCGSTLG